MAAPKLSIVMPAYNHEQFVGEAIEGVLNQTFSDFEFIIIDDGSQDTTADVIHGFSDKRIQYYYQENQDAYNAINNGMAKAQGEFLSILNSDDVYLPQRFEQLFAFQKEHKAHCLFTDVIPISDPEFGWNQWHAKNRKTYFDLSDLYAAFLHGNFMVTTSNLFMSDKAVKQVGNFAPIRYLHDYDYMFRLLRAFPNGVHYLDDKQLLKYRIHGANTLSQGAITAREQDQSLIRQSLLQTVDETQRVRVETGLNRLIALEHELLEVKSKLAGEANQSNASLIRRVYRKARGLLS